MRIYKDEKLIKRNTRIGQITAFGGMGILVVGMYISFTQVELVWAAWACLIIGFLLSQLGIYFGNRWGRRPRPDEHLDAALKGLDERWAIYHYTSPVAHLLAGPGGLWVLLPYHQSGIVTYEKGRYKTKGGGIGQAYLRIFAQESLGRPDLEAKGDLDLLKSFFEKQSLESPDPQCALVFTSERATISEEAEKSEYHLVSVKKLKDLVRKLAKENAIPPQQLETIQNTLSKGLQPVAKE